MYVNDSSTSLVKLAFLSLLLIGALTFCGGLAMADTGLFNWQMQGAEADALRAQTQAQADKDARQLPFLEEQWRIAGERLRLEAELQKAAMVTEAVRTQNFRQNRDMIALSVTGFAGFAAVLLMAYAMFRFIRQAFDRRTPDPRPPAGTAGAAATQPPVAPQNSGPGAHRRPTSQPAYLRRNNPQHEPVVIVQDVAPYERQSGTSGNGHSGREA